jgi:6-phosphogluconolactonase (cycloisomerase 2 family)
MLDVRAKTMSMTASLAALALAAATAPTCPAQSTQPALFVVNNSSADSGVTSFTINPDGTLNFVQEVNPSGSLNPQAIDVSPNGRWLIVGHGTASSTVEQLTFLEVHADATMSIVLETTTPDSPVDVVWIDNEYAVVTNTSASPDQVIVYRFDPAVPSISLVWFSTLSTSTFDIAIDRAHDLLYPRASTSTVWPMRINPDRSLTKLTTNPVPTGIFFLGPNLSPDGSKLYFGGGISSFNGLSSRWIGGFNIDTATGALTQMPDSPYLSPPSDGTAGPSPKEVDVSSDGQFAFVNHGGTAHIKGFTIDAQGRLADIPASYFDVGGQGDSGTMTVLGNHLFVLRRYSGSGGNPPSGVVSLTINPDGTLTPNGATVPTQGSLPWDLVAWPGVAGPCPADVDGSGVVDVDDLIAVILGWGPCGKPPASCPGDVNNSGAVDVDDLVAVILAWGPCA